MLFTGPEWTTIVANASAVAVALGTVWAWVKKHDPKLAKDVPNGFRKVLDGIEGLAESPWFASEAAAGKLELRHVTDKLLQSHLGQAAAQALASFGKTYNAMSESEKGTATEMVQAFLNKAGVQITAQQAVAALLAADKDIQSQVPIAQAATERSQALQPQPQEA